MAGDFGTLSKKFDQLASEFDGRQLRKSLEVVGRETKGDIVEAVRGDLGDTSMSGWRRGKPTPIVGRYDIVSDHEIDMTPTPRSRGPMRVLEQGRNQGNAGGIAGPGIIQNGENAGTTARNKNGSLRKVRARKAKRWNGRTQGKGTWGDATDRVVAVFPKEHRERVEDSMSKLFMKG